MTKTRIRIPCFHISIFVLLALLSCGNSTPTFLKSEGAKVPPTLNNLADPAAPNNSTNENQTLNSQLIGDPISFPDVDLLELNKGILTEEDLKNVKKDCTGLGKGDICRTRPGFGSGLFYDRGSKMFYTTTDRGPNQDCEDLAAWGYKGKNVGNKGKGFPVPNFAPTMTSFKVSGSNVEIVKHTPLLISKAGNKTASVTGISNTANDDVAYGANCDTDQLPLNPAGVDIEDISVLPGNRFVGVDEFSPSVVIWDNSGLIKHRYVPSGLKGVTTASAGYPVSPILPNVLTQRRANRGFEVGITSNGGDKLYAVLQSPLGDKKDKKYKDSLIIRVVELDISNPEKAAYTGMYAFKASNPTDYKAAKTSKKPVDIKYSAGFWVSEGKMVVRESVDEGVKLFLLDLNGATNLKGKFDDSLVVEEAKDPNIKLATTEKIWDSDDLPQFQDSLWTDVKWEGLTMVDPTTLYMISDNDFSLNNNPASRIIRLKLSKPLIANAGSGSGNKTAEC
ncbi:hypothetical protein BKA69DRAFT_1082833 [Paraphysoderma sedebokerense]|nr:hypothetical protein BKA69DRAFT_1082833 [Paraphysoderma sedebokerense]